MKIQEIKEWLSGNPRLQKAELDQLLQDERAGVRKLVESYQRRMEKQAKELERLAMMWSFERQVWSEGYQIVAGVDEAGRGPLAGPVVASAVVLPQDFDVTKLNDSKQLSANDRQDLRKRIEESAISIGVGIVDAEVIDRINILQATYQAMKESLMQITPTVEYILADAVTIPHMPFPQLGIVKGDSKSHSIAAASIIAKTTRDELMIQYGKEYPGYGFEKHMGYGTKAHLDAIQKYGVTLIHRKTFAPIKDWLVQDI